MAKELYIKVLGRTIKPQVYTAFTTQSKTLSILVSWLALFLERKKLYNYYLARINNGYTCW